VSHRVPLAGERPRRLGRAVRMSAVLRILRRAASRRGTLSIGDSVRDARSRIGDGVPRDGRRSRVMGLRVLITNNTAAWRAGTELYVLDLATALLNRGHTPIVFSTHLG